MYETTFRKSLGLGQWYWHTQAENGDIVATSGESYVTLGGARNGFLSAQGYPKWQPGDPWPEGFSEIKVNDDEYIVEHK